MGDVSRAGVKVPVLMLYLASLHSHSRSLPLMVVVVGGDKRKEDGLTRDTETELAGEQASD